MIRLTKTLSALGVAALLVLGGGAGAQASAAPELKAEPATIAAGAQTTVTATGLGGLETASFGLGGGGTLIDPSTGAESTLVQAPVSGGTATVRFTAAEAGDYVVAVGNGETPLAQVTVVVTAAAAPTTPTPQPTVTVTETAAPEPEVVATPISAPVEAGIPGWATVLIVVLAVVVVGAIVTIIVLVARRGRGAAPRA